MVTQDPAKYWPPVARVDNVFGDRNVMCSCVGMEAYQLPG
jgi:glycine dehydrogenase